MEDRCSPNVTVGHLQALMTNSCLLSGLRVSDCRVPGRHLREELAERRFRFSRSGWGLGLCISNRIPGDGCWPMEHTWSSKALDRVNSNPVSKLWGSGPQKAVSVGPRFSHPLLSSSHVIFRKRTWCRSGNIRLIVIVVGPWELEEEEHPSQPPLSTPKPLRLLHCACIFPKMCMIMAHGRSTYFGPKITEATQPEVSDCSRINPPRVAVRSLRPCLDLA